RNLGRWIEACAVTQEPPNGAQAPGRLIWICRPWSLSPSQCEFSRNRAAACRAIEEAAEVEQERALANKAGAQSATQCQVVVDLFHERTDHDFTSGHGCATVRNEGRSSFAYARVASRQRWPIRSAISLRLAPE